MNSSATESKLQLARNLLASGLAGLETSDEWAAVLKRMAQRGRFAPGRLSFRNQLLVSIQMPLATAVATFPAWQRIGRFPVKGSKGIVILQPRPWSRTVEKDGADPEVVGGLAMRTLHVFDVSQTDGEPCPDWLTGRTIPTIDGDEPFDNAFETLRRVALALPERLVSDIALASDLPDAVGGYYQRITRRIVIADRDSQAARFRVLVHELAHAILHGSEDHHSTSQREVEAESTAFVVCHALGLDVGQTSFPYVAGWAGSDPKAAAKRIEESGERINRASRMILDALDGQQADGVEDVQAAA